MAVSSSSSESVFPLEIFKLIIDEVASLPNSDDDTTELSNLLPLALVSKPFCHLSRSLLFSDVTVDVRAESIQGKERSRKLPLLQLLSQQPTLSMWVKNLKFCDSDTYDKSPARAATLNNDTFDILFRFSNLKTLLVDGRHRDYQVEVTQDYRFGWHRLLPHYLNTNSLTSLILISIIKLPTLLIFSCPSLIHLELRKCGLPAWSVSERPHSDILRRGFKLKKIKEVDPLVTILPLAAYCDDLEEIEVTWALGTNASPHTFPMPSPVPHIFKNLRRIISREAVDWSYLYQPTTDNGVNAFPGVKNLNFDLSAIGYQLRFLDQLNMVLGHLQNLETLEINGRYTRILEPLHLHSCIIRNRHSIRKIVIHWKFETYDFEGTLVSTLCDALEAIRGQNTIKSVTLDVQFSITSGEIMNLPHDQWRRFDKLMMEDIASGFPHLRRINIDVAVTVSRWNTHRNTAYEGYTITDFDGFLDEPLSRIRTAAADEFQEKEVKCTFEVYSNVGAY